MRKMRRWFLVSLLTGLSVLSVPFSEFRASLASGIAGSIPIQTGSLKPAELQADFDLMRKALEEAHTGLYRYSTKPEMDRAFDAQRAKLSREMTDAQFLAILTETLANIRCGHTNVSPNTDLQKALSTVPKFPLRVMLEGSGLFVLLNETPDNATIIPGMKILEINGKTPREIVDRILPKLPADGDIESGKRFRLQRNFHIFYSVLVEPATEFTIKAGDATGRVITAKLPGVLDTERKDVNAVNRSANENLAKLSWSRENVAMRFLKDPEIAQIRIRGFNGSDYSSSIENSFKTLKDKGTKTLIVDLRGNGGGADMFGAMLVSYLTDKPFRYFDHINVKTISPSFKEFSDWRPDREGDLKNGVQSNPKGGYLVTAKLHPGVAEQPPGKYPFTGKVVVLIDGGTFSTAADVCAVIHHLKRGEFIGDETGGGYYGNNSGMQTIVTLPNSKARVTVPMYEYWNAVPGYDGKRRGTKPDHVIETKVADLLRGFDQQLDRALKLASMN
jgi:Peptidase family S41